jgi:hypothetical protein
MTTLHHRSFLVKRYNIVLKVSIQPDQHIHIDPYHCTPENKRLWSIVAQTYLTLAQTAVNGNKGANPHALLLSVFDSKGWDIITSPGEW